jgi:hypothetical protein
MVQARDGAARILNKTKTVEQIEEELLAGLSHADASHSGTLDASQFADCVKALDLGLTNGEVCGKL